MTKLSILTIFIFIFSFYGCNEKHHTVSTTQKTIYTPIVQPEITTSKAPIEEIVLADNTDSTSSKKIKIEPSALRKSCEIDVKDIDEFQFDIIKKGVQNDNTLLVVGGIQGDEPGGFMAASLMTTHYDIQKGSVWIVPNLNFYSIIKRSRGPFGDMNRKFAALSKDDPEYETVQRIKKYITDEQVKLILNLHDGSGFYRPTYIDRWHQPRTWGQSSVIDQEILHNVEKYGNTYEISEEVVAYLNKFLLKEEHRYRTKNTHTKFNKTHEEQEMAKTLTYYAVTHGKAAFGHETSKSLNVSQRVYYKLIAIEKYMDIMGIKYKRKFPLTLAGVKHALNDDISITFNDTNIKMPLKDIRNIQNYFPVKKDGIVTYLPSNPLIKIIKQDDIYSVYYGNRRLTRLVADYTEYLNFDTEITINIDNQTKKIKFGDTINVSKDFSVIDDKRFRVNVIGYTNKSGIETDKKISKNMFMQRYSIEKNGNIYRIEFYKNKKFAGMILVNFIS